jgi:hypothetical protein
MSEVNPKSRVHDLFSALLGALGAFLLISTRWEVDTSGPYPFYKGPLLFPLLALSLMVVASLPAVWRLLKPDPKSTWHVDGLGGPGKSATMFVVVVVYLAAIAMMGLEIASFLFVSGSLYWLGYRSPKYFLGLPLAYVLLLYLLFKRLLGLYFPNPYFWDFLGF